MYKKTGIIILSVFLFLLASTAQVQSSHFTKSNCPSPYHVITSDDRCVWSCGEGTTPDTISNECICKSGYTQTGTDSFGRRVCSLATSSPSPSPTPTLLPSIKVTSPNGGETWTIGSTVTISWTSSDVSYVYLDLTNSAGGYGYGDSITNLVNVVGNPGQTTWTVPTYAKAGTYKLKIGTCSAKANRNDCAASIADVYDFSDGAITLAAAAPTTTAGCSIDSDCPITGTTWAGATFCDSTGLKVMQYKVAPTCQSGTCIFTTSVQAIKEDCSSSGKICDFTTTGGGVYACIAGTPPASCPLNTQLTTRCICGSNYADSYNIQNWAYNCCASDSGTNLIGGSSCPTCSSNQLSNCYNQTSCTNVGGYWYNNYCSSSPQVTTTPTYSPIYPTYTPPLKPSNFCNTDQDCSWSITNNCPESAGANWECRSLLQSASGYAIAAVQSSVCPQGLSSRPSANCGCIQNNCIVFENERPKEELPKKIEGTEVDTTGLLATVIQLEQLKVKFEFLQSAINKLAKYYNTTGDFDSASRWQRASQLLQTGIDRIEEIKDYIREKISDFQKEDLRKVKKDIKSVIAMIKDIVKILLEKPSPTPSTSPQPEIINLTSPLPSITPSPQTTDLTTPIPTPIINQTNTNSLNNQSSQIFLGNSTKLMYFYPLTRDGSRNLALFDLETKQAKNVTFLGYESIRPKWSPDGSNIYYQTGTSMHMVNSAGDDDRDLGSGSDIDWSPDGSQFVYSSGFIYRRNLTSTGVIVARGNRPLWSPDRTKLLFTTYNSSLQKVTIYTIDSGYTYGNTNRPGETPIIEYVAFGDPKWSPDSRKISFFKNLDNGKTLMTANADGSEMKQLGVTQISDVYWSPDSSKVVYAKLERVGGETGPLYIVNADGTGNKLIANSSYVGSYADWHPTGSKLVYNKMIGALGYIAVINPDGTGEFTFGRGRYPVWSSDGTKITFDRLNNTDNKMYIYEMNADGTGETLLTRGERPVYQPGQRI